MKNKILSWTIIFAFILFTNPQQYCAIAGTEDGRDNAEVEIWALEEAYFTNLYKADYAGVLAIVHSQFLGWPGAVAKPMDREESTCFMKQLIPQPTPCTLQIERSGIRLLGEVALTHYVLHVNCTDTASGLRKVQSSRITHTWAKEGARWKLLGGMSYDK